MFSTASSFVALRILLFEWAPKCLFMQILSSIYLSYCPRTFHMFKSQPTCFIYLVSVELARSIGNYLGGTRPPYWTLWSGIFLLMLLIARLVASADQINRSIVSLLRLLSFNDHREDLTGAVLL